MDIAFKAPPKSEVGDINRVEHKVCYKLCCKMYFFLVFIFKPGVTTSFSKPLDLHFHLKACFGTRLKGGYYCPQKSPPEEDNILSISLSWFFLFLL